MYGFHTILRIFGVGYVRDTQCGFKLFSRSAAQQLFSIPTPTDLDI
jgi:dolichyl-phosphate beta-glucosyltransferase